MLSKFVSGALWIELQIERNAVQEIRTWSETSTELLDVLNDWMHCSTKLKSFTI